MLEERGRPCGATTRLQRSAGGEGAAVWERAVAHDSSRRQRERVGLKGVYVLCTTREGNSALRQESRNPVAESRVARIKCRLSADVGVRNLQPPKRTRSKHMKIMTPTRPHLVHTPTPHSHT